MEHEIHTFQSLANSKEYEGCLSQHAASRKESERIIKTMTFTPNYCKLQRIWRLLLKHVAKEQGVCGLRCVANSQEYEAVEMCVYIYILYVLYSLFA